VSALKALCQALEDVIVLRRDDRRDERVSRNSQLRGRDDSRDRRPRIEKVNARQRRLMRRALRVQAPLAGP
jgi:hypothetical protein